MSLKYALLGAIGMRPRSGYDTKRFFDRFVGMFWNAHHGQIYRLLQKLEGEGLVTQQIVEQGAKPDKKIYDLTSKGEEELKDWLEDLVQIRDIKDEFTLWFFFADRLDRSKVRLRLTQSRGMFEERLQRVLTFQQGRPRAASKWIMHASTMGTRFYEDRIRWIEETIELIDQGKL